MKYGLSIKSQVISSDVNRLTNQLWKLIPMRENEENWKGHLEAVILEIAGLKELMQKEELNFIILLSKLEGLQYPSVSFETYRAAVFKCISLLRELRL